MSWLLLIPCVVFPVLPFWAGSRFARWRAARIARQWADPALADDPSPVIRLMYAAHHGG